MDVEKYISPFVQAQFPDFYKENGPNFIAFVKAYFEWMESYEQPLYHARKAYDYFDINTTADNFIKHFKNKYMFTLPDNMLADKRLLTKHILDLYRSKGSLRSYELLFRILFNEDISVYLPGKDMFRLSDNQWSTTQYLEISDFLYFDRLIGKQIYNSANTGAAIVENYCTKIINSRVTNILIISSVDGEFNYGQRIFCPDLYVNQYENDISLLEYNSLSTEAKTAYSIAINANNAPTIEGSLSSLGIVNGGKGFSVGELLKIDGTGIGGIARVAAVADENGKVNFALVDGGFGFSMNAQISVIGGGGVGASFSIGGLVNKELFLINSDIINDYLSTQLDITSEGFRLFTSNSSGTFTIGNILNSTVSTNVLPIDVTLLVANNLSNGEILSNSSLGIANVIVTCSDGSLLSTTGTGIVNANLAPGVSLVSSVTSTVVSVNNILPVQSVSGSGTITSANTTVINVNNVTGYFVPGYGVTDANTAATAKVINNLRETNWLFPVVNVPDLENLDTSIKNALTNYTLEVGTISFINKIDPGIGYSSNPNTSILQPEIYQLMIPDGFGGYKGFDAVVNAHAGSANGVVTAVDIYDSGFGWNPDQYVNLISSNVQNQSAVKATTVVDRHGQSAGFFKNRTGFLSDTQKLQDSYYYQTYSYDILASRMIDTYETFVKNLVHPAGIALFGSYSFASSVSNFETSPAYVSIAQITP